jgi:DNA modification methylase
VGSVRSLQSAKRSAKERESIHRWHPYYAGYSERFVASALRYLNCTTQGFILDPWGGSGTTGVVSGRAGLVSLCMDINPVMATFSAAKSFEVLAYEDDIAHFFNSLSAQPKSAEPLREDDPLKEIFDLPTAALIRDIVEAIPFSAHAHQDVEAFPSMLLNAVRDESLIISPHYAFCMAVLFVALREISGTKLSANPTWLLTNEQKVHMAGPALVRELKRTARNMLMDLREFFSSSKHSKPSYAMAGNVKDMPLKSGSVDWIITSPPYLTRIDYAMSTTPELALFDNELLVGYVRHQTTGAPVITKEQKEQKQEWGPLCNRILNEIRNHPTKAAESYYWKNIVQYFMDTEGALNDIARVLRPGGRALIVVQSSYFKEIEIPLGDIYMEMAQNQGFIASRAFREEVKGHMAHVNTKSSQYKKNKVYFEDVVLVTKAQG